MKKLVSLFIVVALIFTPSIGQTAKIAGIPCAARMISDLHIKDKHVITYEVLSGGTQGFKFFYTDWFGNAKRDILRGDGPYHGTVTVVISDYDLASDRLGIDCK